MRYLLAAALLLLSTPGFGDPPIYDRTLAVEASRAYIESWRRSHPKIPRAELEWDKIWLDFAEAKRPGFAGFLLVSVPYVADAQSGAATIFEVTDDDSGKLYALDWCYVLSLRRALETLRDSIAAGQRPWLLPAPQLRMTTN